MYAIVSNRIGTRKSEIMIERQYMKAPHIYVGVFILFQITISKSISFFIKKKEHYEIHFQFMNDRGGCPSSEGGASQPSLKLVVQYPPVYKTDRCLTSTLLWIDTRISSV